MKGQGQVDEKMNPQMASDLLNDLRPLIQKKRSALKRCLKVLEMAL
jgi:hypothetical protein